MRFRTNKLVQILIHILIWLGVILMPYIFSLIRGTPQPARSNIAMIVLPLGYVLVFYLNYLVLINRFLFKKKVLSFIFLNLAIIAAVEFISYGLRQQTAETYEAQARPIPPRDSMPIMVNISMLAMVVGVSVAIKMTKNWYETQARIKELEKENTAAELQQLKSQLNPHFLFNSINSIYALIAFDPDRAQFAVHSLSDMLRYQLYEAQKERISLQKEVEFVRGYCDLMKLRMPENLTVNMDLPVDCERKFIAPLLFITLVENAFKHGVSQSKPSYIGISIELRSSNMVSCTVRNSSYPKTDKERSGSGIGLENLRKRLSLLYPNKYSFRAEEIGSEFIAQVIIIASNK